MAMAEVTMALRQTLMSSPSRSWVHLACCQCLVLRPSCPVFQASGRLACEAGFSWLGPGPLVRWRSVQPFLFEE